MINGAGRWAELAIPRTGMMASSSDDQQMAQERVHAVAEREPITSAPRSGAAWRNGGPQRSWCFRG
jgi:hypothetical protein